MLNLKTEQECQNMCHDYNIPVLPVFADARNKFTQAFVTCMFCQKKLNICINKILIYNRKWFHPFSSYQTCSKHRNYQAIMCVLCLQWRHLFSAVGRIWHWEINKFTKSLNVSPIRLKKQYFIENSLKTSKTHKLSMWKDADNEVTLFHV